MENTVRLKVFLFKFCLFNFLLFSEFGLLKFLLLLWSESSILQVLSIASPWILLICDSVLFLSHLFVNFGNLFSPFLRLKILCDYYNLLFEILLIKKSILRQRALQIVQLKFVFIKDIPFDFNIGVSAKASFLKLIHFLIKVISWYVNFLIRAYKDRFGFGGLFKRYEIYGNNRNYIVFN